MVDGLKLSDVTYILLLLSHFSPVRPCATHRRQPTRLRCPWYPPGKNTGVGCHCLLQCMKVKSETEVAESCLTLSNPMDCSLPGSSIHGIFQESTGVGCHCLLPVTYIGKYYLAIRIRKKSFHLWQHGWNWRALH